MANLEIEVNTSYTQDSNAEIMLMLQQVLGLDECNRNLIKTVEFHQHTFERMDNKEMACNAIITGMMEETPLDGEVTDEEKSDKIF